MKMQTKTAGSGKGGGSELVTRLRRFYVFQNTVLRVLRDVAVMFSGDAQPRHSVQYLGDYSLSKYLGCTAYTYVNATAYADIASAEQAVGQTMKWLCAAQQNCAGWLKGNTVTYMAAMV